MTKQQRTALRYPTLLAEECVHHRYARSEGTFRIVMTVNAGYE